MKAGSIDVTKISKDALFHGKKGIYLNLVMFENRDGPDQFGNEGYIQQDIGKDRRARGEKGPIIGNWKTVDTTPLKKMTEHNRAKGDGFQPQQDDSDPIPF
jgi:hypothetical protein